MLLFCSSDGCSEPSRAAFSNSISIITSMNSRSASTAVDQTPADGSFTAWPNKLLPLTQHLTVPLFMVSHQYVREGDIQFLYSADSHLPRNVAALAACLKQYPNRAATPRILRRFAKCQHFRILGQPMAHTAF